MIRCKTNMLLHTHKGFTFVELLVTIAIIGILASVVLASLNNAREKGEIAAAKSELRSIETAIEILHDDTGVYPHAGSAVCPAVNGANNEVDLADADSGLTANGLLWARWNGPYMTSVIDPWGTPYYLDEDYECLPATDGCDGIDDVADGTITSALVSCGPNMDNSGSGGSCAYDDDNIVLSYCRNAP